MTRRFSLLILLITAVGTALLATIIPPLWAWLITINLAALLTYGYDKMIAGSRMVRVPELVLLLLAALGGFVGAAIGVWRFRHKTRKPGFLGRFVVAVIIGVLLTAALFYFTNTLL